MDIFNQILNAIQPELISIVICLAAGTTGILYQQAMQHLPANVRVQVEAIATTTVKAVEQKYADGSPGSTIKKQEAMQMLLSLCQALHIPLDAAHASAAIESVVYEVNMLQQAKAIITRSRTAQTPTMPMLPTVTATAKPLSAG